MSTILRVAGCLCLIIALFCLIGGFFDMPRKLGVAVLSMAFWGGAGLLLLSLPAARRPA